MSGALQAGTRLRGTTATYTIKRALRQGTFGITYLATMPMTAQGALGQMQVEANVCVKEFLWPTSTAAGPTARSLRRFSKK